MRSFAVFIGGPFGELRLVAVGQEIPFGESESLRVLLTFGVAGEDVGFDVEGGAGGEGVEDDGDLDGVAVEGGDGEGDAFDGDGALGDYVLGEGGGEFEFEAPVGGSGGLGGDGVEGE